MEVIQATLNELEIVAKLFDEYRQFYLQYSDIEKARIFLKQRIEKNESAIFLALDKLLMKGAGFTQLYPSFSSVSMGRIFILNDLYVNPDFRKKNIGSMLIDKAKQYAIEQKALRLVLETDKTNLSAQNLYNKTSWTKDNDHFYYSWENLDR